MRSGQASVAALRERVAGVEERLAREMEQHQTTELQRREAELQARSHLVLSQQLQDQLSEMTSRLQAEREAKAVQVSCDARMFIFHTHVRGGSTLPNLFKPLYYAHVCTCTIAAYLELL